MESLMASAGPCLKVDEHMWRPSAVLLLIFIV